MLSLSACSNRFGNLFQRLLFQRLLTACFFRRYFRKRVDLKDSLVSKWKVLQHCNINNIQFFFIYLKFEKNFRKIKKKIKKNFKEVASFKMSGNNRNWNEEMVENDAIHPLFGEMQQQWDRIRNTLRDKSQVSVPVSLLEAVNRYDELMKCFQTDVSVENVRRLHAEPDMKLLEVSNLFKYNSLTIG